MSEITATPEIRHQCRHIMTAGHRCGSPCLRNEHFCFYHHTTRKPAPLRRDVLHPDPTHFSLPIPEDRTAIQLSIGEVLRRIANHELDPRRAGLLLYGLQIASHNLIKAEPQPANATIEVVTEDPDQGILAPAAELILPASERQFGDGVIESWELLKAQQGPDLTETE